MKVVADGKICSNAKGITDQVEKQLLYIQRTLPIKMPLSKPRRLSWGPLMSDTCFNESYRVFIFKNCLRRLTEAAKIVMAIPATARWETSSGTKNKEMLIFNYFLDLLCITRTKIWWWIFIVIGFTETERNCRGKNVSPELPISFLTR